MNHPGDPTPRSSADVTNDQLYRVIVNEIRTTQTNVNVNHVVVFHCGTETYWSTEHLAGLLYQSTAWYQVEEKTVVETRTVWIRI